MTNRSTNTDNDEIVWTPDMPDRRKNDRREGARELFTNGKAVSVNTASSGERRRGNDRRKTVSVTITGRAIDVEH